MKVNRVNLFELARELRPLAVCFAFSSLWHVGCF